MYQKIEKVFIYLGILIRLLLLLPQSPTNPDDHTSVIYWVVQHHSLPSSIELSHSFHPPVYPLMAAGWISLLSPHWDGCSIEGLKMIQLLSVLISIFNLILIVYGVCELNWISKGMGRTLAIGVAAFQPMFLIWSGFISNDGLSYLFGTLILIAIYKFLTQPSLRRLFACATVLGIGISTKFSLICFLPAFLVGLYASQSGRLFSSRAKIVAVFLTFILASPKMIMNVQEGLNPFFHNMQMNPIIMIYQRESFTDPVYRWGFDFIRLWREPYFTENPPYSILNLLFASFWNDYFPNQTNFTFLKSHSFFVFPRLELIGGFLLSVFMLGAFFKAGLFVTQHGARFALLSKERCWYLGLILSVVTLLGLVVFLGLRFDAWSCIQGRLLFPLFAILTLFLGRAEEGLRDRPMMRLMYGGIVVGFILNSLFMILIEIAVFYLSIIF